MFCGSCGTQVPDGQNFCPNCGAPLSSAGQAGQQVAQSSVDPYGQPVQPAQQVQQPYGQPAQQPYGQPAQQVQQPYGQQQFDPNAPQPPYQQQYGQPGMQQPYGQPPVAPYGQPGQTAFQGYTAEGASPQYQKLGGWLLFFVVMAILGIIASLGSIAGLVGIGDSLPRSYGTYVTVSIVITLIETALNIGYVVFIFMRKDIFLKYFQIIQIVDILLNVVLAFYVTTLPHAEQIIGSIVPTTVGTVIGGVAGMLLFTLYFCKSVRVRTYMGSTSYIDKALFKFSAN